jgi:DMSO/TMAO reductase YedYZ molybdopterin-dependent catalytic subunit
MKPGQDPSAGPDATMNRRRFVTSLAWLGAAVGGVVQTRGADAPAAGSVNLGFENGERPLVTYPQKRPLLRLTSRPPQLETPFTVFNEGITTPNDAFFVRYHLTNAPPIYTELGEDKFRLQIGGKVNRAIQFSLSELRSQFENTEVVAVNQCSGNSRGFFQPRVPGGQLGNGAMGNARWRGVRLRDVLQKAGVATGARQVLFNGMDTPALPQTPDFIKAIDVDQALAPDLMLAWEMNGQPLPWLNGFPLRLVIPGHYGTYWVKHLNEITVVDEEFKGFWMNPAYRIPDDPCAAVEPGTTPRRTIPISRFNVRSFITSVADGAQVSRRRELVLRGIAFDGGHGIREVVVTTDEGRTWREAELGNDIGRYSFREWTLRLKPGRRGPLTFKVKATNRLGESQPLEPLWNPAGYMRNCVEQVTVRVV